MSHKIFISYSRVNFDIVNQARQAIHHAVGEGRCWMDLDGIESGERNFPFKIRSAIEESDVFLFFLSETSCKSRYALQELRFANRRFKGNSEKRLVFVRVDDVLTTKLTGVGNLDSTDVIDWRDIRQREKLISDLKKWVGHAPCSQRRLVKELSKLGHWRKTRAFMERKGFLDAFEMANRVDEDHPVTQAVLHWLKKNLDYSEAAVDKLLTEAREPPKFTPLKIMEALSRRNLWKPAKAELKKRGVWKSFVSAHEFDEDSPGYRPAFRWLPKQVGDESEVKTILGEARIR